MRDDFFQDSELKGNSYKCDSPLVLKEQKNLHSLPDCTRPLRLNPFSSLSLPLYLSRIEGGFPSPADDYFEETLDLNQHLIKHRDATFFVRATGVALLDAGMCPGDLLIVDRALTANSGNIIIAVLDGELLVRRLVYRGNSAFLCPENSNFSEIQVTADRDFSIWGVVTTVIHSVL